MKCPNCKSERYLALSDQYWCRRCGEIFDFAGFDFDGQHLVTPDLTRWRTFEEMPNPKQIISVLHYERDRPVIHTDKFCQSDLDSFKKFCYKWIPVFLPKED